MQLSKGLLVDYLRPPACHFQEPLDKFVRFAEEHRRDRQREDPSVKATVLPWYRRRLRVRLHMQDSMNVTFCAGSETAVLPGYSCVSVFAKVASMPAMRQLC